MADTDHYGKILLFGEYSLLHGSRAFTIPYRGNKVRLHFSDDNDPDEKRQIAIQSNRELRHFYEYIKGHQENTSRYVDIQAMHEDLDRGLFLESDIPSGYGLGSSGALIAALFSRFGKKPFNSKDYFSAGSLKQLQDIFSFLEAFFHGKSSGIDPLSSYTDRPILISDGIPAVIDHQGPFLTDQEAFFLIDTKISRKTAPFVKLFREKCQDSNFLDMLYQQYIPLNNGCIESLLESSHDFSEKLFSLSDLQLRHFREMIPESFERMWANGLSSGRYTMKLCGAGGGGYLLCYASAQDNLKDILQYRHVEKISV